MRIVARPFVFAVLLVLCPFLLPAAHAQPAASAGAAQTVVLFSLAGEVTRKLGG